jgi:hypothetical protein
MWGGASNIGLGIAGAALIAFDIANTITGIGAGPDTGLIGGPMLSTAIFGAKSVA